MGVRDKIAKAIMGIKAYHSSPHDFDHFDLAKIGTGEGAQVYGHGLYFAENPAVSGQGGQYWNQFKSRFGGDEAQAMEMLQSSKFDRGQAVEAAQRQIDELQRRINPGGVFDKPHMADAWRRAQEQIAELSAHRDLLASGKPVGPRTYEVNIKADPAHMLDWDKPLSGQSEAVREALSPQRLGLKAAGPLGEKGYYGWTDAQNRLIGRAQTKDLPAEIFDPREMAPSVYRGGGTWKPPEASEILREAGIPGIKYLDEGSRQPANLYEQLKKDLPLYQAKGNKSAVASIEQQLANPPNLTSNYVVFDPSIVDIMKKYGVVGAPAGTLGMGALADESRYEVQP
jgi:hypothetical protein